MAAPTAWATGASSLEEARQPVANHDAGARLEWDGGAPPVPAAAPVAFNRYKARWPYALAGQKLLPRGTEFLAYVRDKEYWRRTGYYHYIVVGWDYETKKYEAWEPTGLHTWCFAEKEVRTGMAKLSSYRTVGRNAGDYIVASWREDEVWKVPALEKNTGIPQTEGRDETFPPVMSGWTPYGTLEMAAPMLFHLRAKHSREPERINTICDIGAGHGRIANFMTLNWDLSVKAIDVVLPAQPEYDVELFDGRCLPFADKSIDCSMFCFVLHHCRHFEAHRVLLSEAARVTRHYIFVAEDCPADDRDRKQTRGHDRLGQFNDVQAWRTCFRRMKLRLLHDGPLWKGPKNGPSPYPCTRRYFVLEVPSWLQPAPAVPGLGGLAACCRVSSDGTTGTQPASLPTGGTVEVGQIADSSSPPLEDLRKDWIAEELVSSTGAATETCSIQFENGSPCALLTSFDALRLPDQLRKRFCSLGFAAPTPIQQAVVPCALQGGDLIGVARTGSGKTLAFLLPTLLRLLSTDDKSARRRYALVLAPTRELVLQTGACADALLATANGSDERGTPDENGALEVSVATVWGGGCKWQQKQRLAEGASIVVATPGRLLDLACEEEDEGKTDMFASVRVLVLDEGDRMLEDGMNEQLDAISRRCSAESRQTLFFSATWPEEISKLARPFCKTGSPILIRVGRQDTTALSMATNSNISQRVEVFDDDETELEREKRKQARLYELLSNVLSQGGHQESKATVAAAENVSKALVFCMTKKSSDSLVEELNSAGFPARAVHGGKMQKERLWNLDSFAKGECRVLVATDVLGRGLDIPAVTHVFVYDFPGTVEEYTHRIGRTARGVDTKGTAVAFFEYYACLPDLAKEVIDFLEAAQQPVPTDLVRIAAEVANGTRYKRGDVCTDIGGRGGSAAACAAIERGAQAGRGGDRDFGNDDVARLPLASQEELGEWHARGQRSWHTCLGSQLPAVAKGGWSWPQASGWFVLHTGGRLRSHEGNGSWRIVQDSASADVDNTNANLRKRLAVELGGVWRVLQLRLRVDGQYCLNFKEVSADTGSVERRGLIGWASRSKTYRVSID